MKKGYIIFYIIVGVGVILLTTILVLKPKKDLKVTLIPKDYHYLYSNQEEMAFDVELMINNKDAILTNSDAIHKTYLENKTEMYLIELLNIKDLQQQVNIKNETFYKYNYHFILVGEIENNSICLSNAILTIQTISSEYRFSIGDVSLRKVSHFGSNNNELAISYLKGTAIEELYRKKLSSVIIGFRNNSQHNIKITSVEILANGISFSDNEKQELSNPQVYDVHYDLYNNYENSKISISLLAQENKYFLLPIKYEEPKYLSRCGLKIIYEKNGTINTMYFDDFLFFTENVISDHVFNNLTIYRYARN